MSLDEFIIGAAFLSDRVPVKLPWMSPEGESGDRASPTTPGEWRKDTFDKPLMDTWDDFSDTKGRSIADNSGGIVSKQYTENVMTKLALGELSISSVSMGLGQKVKSNVTKPLNENKIEDMGFEELFASSPVKSKAAFKSDNSSSITDSYFAQKEKQASNKSKIVDVGLEEMFSRRPSTSSPCLGNAQPRSNQPLKYVSPDDVLDMPNNSFTKGLNEKKELLKSSKSFPNETLLFGNRPGVVSPGPFSGRSGTLSELGNASYFGDKPSILNTYNNTSPIGTGYVPSFISDNPSNIKPPTRKLPISATQPLKANKALESDRNSVLGRKVPFEEYKKSGEIKKPDFFGSSGTKSVSDKLPQYESDEKDTERPQIVSYRPNTLPNYTKSVPSFLDAVVEKDDIAMRPLSTLFATYGQSSCVTQDLDNPNFNKGVFDNGLQNQISVTKGMPSFEYKDEFVEKSTNVISNVHNNFESDIAKTENTEVTTCSPASNSRSTQPSIIDKVDEIQPVAQKDNRIQDNNALGMGECIHTSKSRDAENIGSFSGISPLYAGDAKNNEYCRTDKTNDTKKEDVRPNVTFDGFSSDEDTHVLHNSHVTKPMSQQWNSTRLQPASNPVSAWITKAIESDDDISTLDSENVVETFSKVEKESCLKRHQAFNVPTVTIDPQDTTTKSSSEIKERKLPKANEVILVEPASVKREKIKKKKERREKQFLQSDKQKTPTDIEISGVESTISSDASSKPSAQDKPSKIEAAKATKGDKLADAATGKTSQRHIGKLKKSTKSTHVTSEVDGPCNYDVTKPPKRDTLADVATRKTEQKPIAKLKKSIKNTRVTSEVDGPCNTDVVKPSKKEKLAGAAIRKDAQNPIRKTKKCPTHTCVTSEDDEPYTTKVVKPPKKDKLTKAATRKDVQRPIVKLKKCTKHKCVMSEDDEYRVAASEDEEIDREIAKNRNKIMRKIKEIRQGIASLKSSSIQIKDMSEHDFKHNIMPLMRSMELAYLERDISLCKHCNAQIANPQKKQKPMLPERKQIPQLPKQAKKTSMKEPGIAKNSYIDPDLVDMFNKLHEIYRKYGKKPPFSDIPSERLLEYLKNATDVMKQRAAEEMSEDEELNGWENDDIGHTVTIILKASDIIPEKYSKRKTMNKVLKALETKRNNANNRVSAAKAKLQSMPKEEEDSDLENELDRLGHYQNSKKDKKGSFMKIFNCLKGEQEPKGKPGQPEISEYDTVSTNLKYGNAMVKSDDKAKVVSMVKSKTRKKNLNTESNTDSTDIDKVKRYGATQKPRDGGNIDTETDIVKKTEMVKTKSGIKWNQLSYPKYDQEHVEIGKGHIKSNTREKNGHLLKSGQTKLNEIINTTKSSIAEDERSALNSEPKTSRFKYNRVSLEDEYDSIGQDTMTQKRVRNETIRRKETCSDNDSDVSDTTTRVTKFVVESSSSSMQSTHDMETNASVFMSSDVSSDKRRAGKNLTVVKSVNGIGASMDNEISASKAKPRISEFEVEKATSPLQNNHNVDKIRSTFKSSGVSNDKSETGKNLIVVKSLNGPGAATDNKISESNNKLRVTEFESKKAASPLQNNTNVDKIRDSCKSSDVSSEKRRAGKNFIVVKSSNDSGAAIDNKMIASKTKPQISEFEVKNAAPVLQNNHNVDKIRDSCKSSDVSCDKRRAGKNLIVVKSVNDPGTATDDEISASKDKTRRTEYDIKMSSYPMQNKHSLEKTENIFKPTRDKRKKGKNLIVVKSLNDSGAIDDTKFEDDFQKNGPFTSHSSKSSSPLKYDKKCKLEKALLSNNESVSTDSSEAFEEVLILPATEKKKESIKLDTDARNTSPIFGHRLAVPMSFAQIKKEKKAMLKRRVKWGFFRRNKGKQKLNSADDKASTGRLPKEGSSSNFDQGFGVNTKPFRSRRDKKSRPKGKFKLKLLGRKRNISGKQFDADHEMDAIQQSDDRNKNDKKGRSNGTFRIKRFGSKKKLSDKHFDLDNVVNTVKQFDDKKNKDRKDRKKGRFRIKRFGSKKNVSGKQFNLDNDVSTDEQFVDKKNRKKAKSKRKRQKISGYDANVVGEAKASTSKEEDTKTPAERQNGKKERSTSRKIFKVFQGFRDKTASTKKDGANVKEKVGPSVLINECANLEDAIIFEKSHSNKAKKFGKTKSKRGNKWFPLKGKTTKEDIGPFTDDTFESETKVTAFREVETSSDSEIDIVKQTSFHSTHDIVEQSEVNDKKRKPKSKRFLKSFTKRLLKTKREAKQDEPLMPRIEDTFERETKVIAFGKGVSSSDENSIIDNVKQTKVDTKEDINFTKRESTGKRFWKSLANKFVPSKKNKQQKEVMIPSTDIKRETKLDSIDETFERETKVVPFREEDTSSDTDISSDIFEKTDVESEKDVVEQTVVNIRKKEPVGGRLRKFFNTTFGGRSKKN